MSTNVKLIGASAGVAIVAAFLPWVRVLGVTAAGTSGDGQLTLALGVIGLVSLLARNRRRFWIAETVCGALVALIALLDMNGFAASGLYLTLLAGAAWTVFAIRERPSRYFAAAGAALQAADRAARDAGL